MSSFSLLRYYFYHRKYVFSVAIATNTKKVGIPGGYIIGNFLKNAGMSADTIPYSLMEKESIIEIIHTLPALICSDFDLQDRAVMELLNKIHSRNVQIPFIISSCHEKEDYEQEAFSHGATLCLDKIQTSLVGKTLPQYAHKYCRKTK